MSTLSVNKELSEDERLDAAAVRLMYRMSIFGSTAGTLIAAAVGVYFWLWHDTYLAPGWILFFALIMVVRVVVYLAYRKADDVESNPSSWLLAAQLTMLASGLGWGAAAVLFYDFNPLITVTVVASMGISGILLLAPSNKIMLSFSAPLFLPLLYVLIMSGEPVAWFTGGILTVLGATMAVHARHMQDGLRESLKLAYENERLAEVSSESKKEVEEANEKLRDEAKVRESVEDQLRGAKIAAEAANMAKDEFLATMSHEIRTPLNGILPILDILRGTKLNTSQQDYLNTAFQSSKHLLTIIDDILDYSKIEAGKLELETVGLNLKELLDSVVRLMSGSAAKKQIDLKASLEPGVRLAMRGDPVRLRQVLTNLVSNAIKFTDTGGVTLTVSKRQEFASETELLFTVKDTGIGMDKETADRLFKPFSQADASTTRTYGGTGLGLVICKRLVELMGGKIGVKSQPRRGSVFWFTVRLKKSLGDMEGSQKQLTDSRLLILANDEDLRKRLEVFAHGWEARVTTTGIVKDAANKLQNASRLGGTWAFDAIIVDAEDLGEESISLIHDVRKDKKLNDMGILVLTPSGELGVTERSLKHIAARMRNSSQGAMKETLESLLSGGGGQDESVSERELAYAASQDVAAGRLKGHVLLVEDNPVNANVAQKLLDVLGMTFEWAKNGREGLEKLVDNPNQYDAVLMDCMMPVMDGYTATREWRSHEKNKNWSPKPIVAMTANAMAGDREKCLEAGMDDYMSKPLNRGLLHGMLAKWIDQGKDGEKTAERPKPEPTTREINSVAAAPQPREEIINQAVIGDLMDIMGDDFCDLITVFLDDSPKSLRQLAKAVDRGTVPELIAPAHSLKSTSANLGALRLSELCKSLEHDARQGSAPKAAERVGRIVQLYKKVAVELKKIRQEYKAAS